MNTTKNLHVSSVLWFPINVDTNQNLWRQRWVVPYLELSPLAQYVFNFLRAELITYSKNNVNALAIARTIDTQCKICEQLPKLGKCKAVFNDLIHSNEPNITSLGINLFPPPTCGTQLLQRQMCFGHIVYLLLYENILSPSPLTEIKNKIDAQQVPGYHLTMVLHMGRTWSVMTGYQGNIGHSRLWEVVLSLIHLGYLGLYGR